MITYGKLKVCVDLVVERAVLAETRDGVALSNLIAFYKFVRGLYYKHVIKQPTPLI